MKRQFTVRGFTIVELIVVIAVLGILVGLATIGYGAWRERAANTELKSDLNNAVLAMNNERNFNNVYPTNLPSSYKSSPNVNVQYKSGDSSSFCIQAVSRTIPTLAYYVNSTTQKQPIKGTCSGGPGAAPLSPGYTAISAGNLHTCAIAFANSAAYCWGYNAGGQLGNGTTTNSSIPVAVTTSGALSGKTIKSIAAGLIHTCVIASDNNVYCWGSGLYGALGNNSTADSSIPVAVTTSGALSGKTIKSIAAGAYYTCALASDNNVYCWGSNDGGRLGNNSTADSSIPVAVTTSGALSGKTVKQVSASGGGSTCVIASDDNTYCWGLGGAGQLGNNSTANSSVPVAVSTAGVLSGKTTKVLAVGYNGSCVIASDNKAYCWGYNNFGELGNNSTANSSVPVAVSTAGVLSGKTITTMSMGIYGTCAIASDSNAYCWGYGGYGGLGNNSTANSSVPVAVSTVGALNSKNLTSTSSSHQRCTIANNNETFCWGINNYGQVGDGTSGANRLTPVKVLDP